MLCDYFGNKLDFTKYESIVNPIVQCYHGVGHGMAYFYVPDYWNDLENAIKKGAMNCQQMTDDQESISNCTYGMFGGIASMYSGAHGFSLPMDTKDPFKLCRAVNDDLKDACYDSMVPTLGVLWGQDVKRLSIEFSKIDQKYWPQSFYNLGDISSRWTALGHIDENVVLENCGVLPQIARISCFKGYAEGLIRNYFPKDAPVLALKFCNSRVLTAKERATCIEGFINEMKNVYPERIEEIKKMI